MARIYSEDAERQDHIVESGQEGRDYLNWLALSNHCNEVGLDRGVLYPHHVSAAIYVLSGKRVMIGDPAHLIQGLHSPLGSFDLRHLAVHGGDTGPLVKELQQRGYAHVVKHCEDLVGKLSDSAVDR